MKKLPKYLVGIAAVLLVLFFSLDIENLSEHKANETDTEFDPVQYANRFWEEELPGCITEAPELSVVTRLMNEDPDAAFDQYGHKLGISKTWYFTVKGSGVIASIRDEYLSVLMDNQDTVHIATSYIFGNAVRDGSGHVDINQFINMTDFNNVSIALNDLVKQRIVQRLVKAAATGKRIQFAGMAEIREDQSPQQTWTLIPVKATLSDGT